MSGNQLMANEPQDIQVINVRGTAVVCFRDLARVVRECRLGQVKQELWALVDREHPPQVLLDFEDKELPTCHVVQCLLLQLHMRLNAHLKLCNVPPDTLWHFRFNGLADRLNIYPTREEALAAAKLAHSCEQGVGDSNFKMGRGNGKHRSEGFRAANFEI
jgi:hypothetical protein